MRKTVFTLLLAMILLLSACAKTSETPVSEAPKQEQAAVHTETEKPAELPAEEKITEVTEAEIVVEEAQSTPTEETLPPIQEDNGAIRITIPGRWEGKYIARKNSREINLVTNTGNFQEDSFFLFHIVLEDFSDQSPLSQRVGTMTNPEGTPYYLLLYYGDEMVYNNDQTYYDLKCDIYDIITSVEAIEGWSLELDFDSSRADFTGDEFVETNGVFTLYIPYIWDQVYRIDSSDRHMDLYALDRTGEYFLLGFRLSEIELDNTGMEKIALMSHESGKEYGLYMYHGAKPEEADAYIYYVMLSAKFAIATSITAENGWSIEYIIGE